MLLGDGWEQEDEGSDLGCHVRVGLEVIHVSGIRKLVRLYTRKGKAFELSKKSPEKRNKIILC